MKLSGLQNTRSSNALGIGLHHVLLSRIRFKRDQFNKLVTMPDKITPKALTLTFTELSTGSTWKEDFYLSEAAYWRIELLCKALGISPPIDAEKVEGKAKLWIAIAAEQYQDEGKLVLHKETREPIQKLFLNKMYPDGNKPQVDGEQDIPTGVFLRLKKWEDSEYVKKSF